MAPLQPPHDEGLPKDTTSATISPAQFDQPSETATLETPPVPITTNTAHDTQTTGSSVWRRLTTGIKRFVARFRPKKAEGDLWRREVCVLLDHGDDELRSTVIALFDPQCEENLISTTCLRDAFPSFVYDSSAGVPIGTSITGLEAYMSIALINMRWSACHTRERRSNDKFHFLPRFYKSKCRVIESNKFELIIGRQTINKLELYKANKDAIAAVRPVNTNISVENVDNHQQSADDRRKEAKEHKKQREKEKKDKEKARK